MTDVFDDPCLCRHRRGVHHLDRESCMYCSCEKFVKGES